MWKGWRCWEGRDVWVAVAQNKVGGRSLGSHKGGGSMRAIVASQ